MLMAAGVLLNLGQWRSPWSRHDNSDWRAAARSINAIGLEPDTPVICPSPFIEARPPAWRPDYQLPGFLYAHLDVYPIQGRPYLFPFQTSPEAERFAMSLTRGTLSVSKSFWIYGWGGNTDFWREWFTKQPELAGWRQTKFDSFGNIELVKFENPRHTGSQ